MNFESSKIENMQYITAYPPEYKSEEKYPVIIFLHGAGTRGNDLEVLKNNAYFKIVAEYQDFPFVTVAPLCSENSWFDMFATLKKLVCKITQADFADSERIYLVGNSMGGYGTWQLAMSMPEMFAAIVPVCGGGMYWSAGRLANVPVWAFHGKQDATVFVEESEKMVNAVNKKGGNAKLTIYPENGHNSWDDTYKNPEVFEWLLSNRNSNIKEVMETFNDSKIYG